MKDRYCNRCGVLYEAGEERNHRTCATNVTPATNSDATNSDATNTSSRSAGRVDSAKPAVVVARAGSRGAGKTKNRRTREAYNAYQREYMRRRRAKP